MNSKILNKIKFSVYVLLFISLYWMTAEILLRRYLWQQIPTPLPVWFVYALIVLNLGLIPYFVKPLVDARKQGRS